MSMPSKPYSLNGRSGERKYLNQSERALFEAELQRVGGSTETFGMVLLYTGFRISEALSLRVRDVDLSEGVLRTECLKKRVRGIYRSVPVSFLLLELLSSVHGLASEGSEVYLWGWSRSTASLRVRDLMLGAGLSGEKACARGLRHSFGIACMEAGIPVHMLQKWLGHARMETTAIYSTAVGAEERKLASRLWRESQ